MDLCFSRGWRHVEKHIEAWRPREVLSQLARYHRSCVRRVVATANTDPAAGSGTTLPAHALHAAWKREVNSVPVGLYNSLLGRCNSGQTQRAARYVSVSHAANLKSFGPCSCPGGGSDGVGDAGGDVGGDGVPCTACRQAVCACVGGAVGTTPPSIPPPPPPRPPAVPEPPPVPPVAPFPRLTPTLTIRFALYLQCENRTRAR
ncbi:hypothetical protein ALC57_05817 [Trachymyrmex cornetzi]|uniref:Uncharacterized protein n=1 Tax=Trachymyrmex cornetzi TaxID=471704 RepID=A0A151J9X1_9HYME|nr:hypothetical protein ALC57_05817 [Trachymyrmex cornetzi]